ncbi:MAG: GNAT family N-acetyltransferase, partial [Lachnospiraceae bacterium]|nr:GNAT family N-acetyltransferase [Lachnospiraceae bacterium]
EEFEGQGHVSELMACVEEYAKEQGIQALTIGVEAAETRNLAIYLHWGYDSFVMSETEDEALVLYYRKALRKHEFDFPQFRDIIMVSKN